MCHLEVWALIPSISQQLHIVRTRSYGVGEILPHESSVERCIFDPISLISLLSTASVLYTLTAPSFGEELQQELCDLSEWTEKSSEHHGLLCLPMKVDSASSNGWSNVPRVLSDWEHDTSLLDLPTSFTVLAFELDASFSNLWIIIDLIWLEMLNTGSCAAFVAAGDDGTAGTSALASLSIWQVNNNYRYILNTYQYFCLKKNGEKELWTCWCRYPRWLDPMA